MVESEARTNKLWCSSCKSRLKKGETVYFELDQDNKMKSCYCSNCYEEIYDSWEDYLDELHPFSGEAVQPEH